jgi:hypothetical protein
VSIKKSVVAIAIGCVCGGFISVTVDGCKSDDQVKKEQADKRNEQHNMVAAVGAIGRALILYGEQYDDMFPPASFPVTDIPMGVRPLGDTATKLGLELNPSLGGVPYTSISDPSNTPLGRTSVNDSERYWIFADGHAESTKAGSDREQSLNSLWGTNAPAQPQPAIQNVAPKQVATQPPPVSAPQMPVVPHVDTPQDQGPLPSWAQAFSGLKPVTEGEYHNRTDLRTIRFKQPVTARYVAWESLSEQNGREFSSAAEVGFLDEIGMQVPTTKARVVFADSEEKRAENGSAKNVLDGNPNTIWHTAYTGKVVPQPHVLVIDIGRVVKLSGFQYLPRQNGPNGRVKGYRIYAQEQPFRLP